MPAVVRRVYGNVCSQADPAVVEPGGGKAARFILNKPAS